MRQVKVQIANQLMAALHEANLSDAYETAAGRENDLPASSSGQDNLFGHIAEALKCLGYEKQYDEYCMHGEIQTITEVKTIYQHRGFANRQDYINAVAVEYELDVNSVRAVADLLGPDEDFDGLLSACADEAGCGVFEIGPLE